MRDADRDSRDDTGSEDATRSSHGASLLQRVFPAAHSAAVTLAGAISRDHQTSYQAAILALRP